MWLTPYRYNNNNDDTIDIASYVVITRKSNRKCDNTCVYCIVYSPQCALAYYCCIPYCETIPHCNLCDIPIYFRSQFSIFAIYQRLLPISVILMDNGDVYTFGSNQYGQLGVGDTNIRYELLAVSRFQDYIT